MANPRTANPQQQQPPKPAERKREYDETQHRPGGDRSNRPESDESQRQRDDDEEGRPRQ